MSSPLILGLDMSQSDTMDRIWSTITNTDALAINNAWVGHPGTLVREYAHRRIWLDAVHAKPPA